MFHFIHSYLEEAWEGIAKSGLWHEGDGVKIMHKPYFPKEWLFESRVAPASPLFGILRELRCPFYIDRVQGGLPMPRWHEYDPRLLASIAEMLGENFWGFQMHEWASNYRSESDRVKQALNEWQAAHPGAPVSEYWNERIDAAKKNVAVPYVEANSVEEWSGMRVPETVGDFLAGANRLWARRAQMTGGPLFPADSFFMAPRIEIAHGAKRLMPEIGWQIPDQRIQLAYTRGMARSASIPFGTYYECWCRQGEEGLTIPYSADTNLNEWNETDLLSDIKKKTGDRIERGGSSRSLQERSWLYSYLSGASAMGEEYGVCNTFRDYHDFELSEYGQVKKNFLDFVAAHPDVGTPLTPFAVVLPAETEILTLNDDADHWLGFPLDGMEPLYAPKIRAAKEKLPILLSDRDSGVARLGTEAHVLQNGRFPDVFDVLHGDMNEALAKYDYLIDLTGDPAFARRYAQKIVPIEKIGELLPQILPVTLDAPLHYLVNRTKNGYLLWVCNENGVERKNYAGDVLLGQAEMHADVLPGALKDPQVRKMAGSGTLTFDGGAVSVTLGAGQWLLLGLS